MVWQHTYRKTEQVGKEMIPQIYQLGLETWLAVEVQPASQDTFFRIIKTAFPELRQIRHLRYRKETR